MGGLSLCRSGSCICFSRLPLSNLSHGNKLVNRTSGTKLPETQSKSPKPSFHLLIAFLMEDCDFILLRPLHPVATSDLYTVSQNP